MSQPDNAAEVHEQLEVVLAQIADAKHEISSERYFLVSLTGHAEQHVHISVVKKLLDRLKTIVERRLKGHVEVSDASEWAELVEKVELRVKQVLELRGKYGGVQELVRIVERLPQQLPTNKPLTTGGKNAEQLQVQSNLVLPTPNDEVTALLPANGVNPKAREAFVQPILKRNGWSIHQFAVEAELDFHTVNDYLKGKTRPNRTTRARMAKALTVDVDLLPA